MKLKELLETLLLEEDGTSTGFTDRNISGELLNSIKDKLLLCDEFKNIKTLNIMNSPTYNVDDKGNPISSFIKPEFELVKFKDSIDIKQTNTDKVFLVPTYELNDESEFNETVDLYSLSLTPDMYDPRDFKTSELGVGIWCMPVQYSPVDFSQLKEIRIIYSPEKLQDMIALYSMHKEDIIDHTLSEVRKALLGGKINVPVHRSVLIRCTERSVKKLIDQLPQ